MCGRYVIEDFQELSERLTNFRLAEGFLESFKPNWNAAPTQQLPVLVSHENTSELTSMTWGLIPFWTKPGEKPKVAPINARSETVAEKPMFRNLVKRNRCIVPANGFYEWRKEGSEKQPYFIRPTDGQLFLFAGLWDRYIDARGDAIRTFTILTTSANEHMAYLHDRQPVILSDDGANEWLDSDIDTFAPLEHLTVPVGSDAIEYLPVSKTVNNTRNNSPELVEPLE